MRQDQEGSPRSADPSTSYIDPLKLASLPRLGRETNIGGPAQRTLAERLNQMRVEDGRRERNKEANMSHQQQQRHGHHPGPSLPLPLHLSAPASASARAGTLYHQSSQLAQQEMVASQQAGELQRKFAGPAPPTSWRRELEEGVRARQEALLLDNDPEERRRSTRAVRQFIDRTDSRGISSLVDLCLSCIATYHMSQPTANTTRESMQELPMHLKERLMALAGREQRCESLNESALHWLLLAEPANQGDGKRERVESADSWDCGDDNLSFSHPCSPFFSTLDLSYARIGSRMLKALMAQAAGRVQSLSLAGWGRQDQSGQKSLLAVPGLVEAIGNLPHLTMLSLAKARLYPTAKDGIPGAKSKESKMLESITFLKRLTRSSMRLEVLDLSGCDWILGQDIANLGWYSIDKKASRSKIIFPRLQHLILTDCPAFCEPESKSKAGLEPSPSYVGKWHAAHHGVAQMTDYSHLVDHRPGLGTASPQAIETRRSEGRQRTPRPRSESAWGQSAVESEEESASQTSLRSSSSSAFPTRCPITGARVAAWEWERARLLDAVRGRWGSAISQSTRSPIQPMVTFIEIYF